MTRPDLDAEALDADKWAELRAGCAESKARYERFEEFCIEAGLRLTGSQKALLAKRADEMAKIMPPIYVPRRDATDDQRERT